MTQKKYKTGELIFVEGTAADRMYDIISGKVEIYANYEQKDERLLATLEEGKSFGEMGMIENQPRSATAVAAATTVINEVTLDDFAEYFKDKPSKVVTIFQNTSHRIRELTREYLEACDAIAQYVKAEENGEEPSYDLMKKMKKIQRNAKK